MAYIKAMVNKLLERTTEKCWIPMQSIAGTTKGDKCSPSQNKKGWNAAVHILKYLNQTSEYCLHLGGKPNKHRSKAIVTYTDANRALDPTNRQRNTSGVITYVYRCPVSWRSHVQKCVALSAVEVEFVDVSEAAQEVLFFSYLLRDLGVENTKPVLCMDSQGCVQVSKDPAKHWKLKQIDTQYYFVWDDVQEGDLTIENVGTANNVADILTNPLKGVYTSQLARSIGLGMPTKGGVEDTSEFPGGLSKMQADRGSESEVQTEREMKLSCR
ncbi:uncharacterized protein UDID_19525 [Ustilago sp. UG-2017a]|nr:uncharacterized protein UDID_19525 [Ustilago sp. UG-2017a]